MPSHKLRARPDSRLSGHRPRSAARRAISSGSLTVHGTTFETKRMRFGDQFCRDVAPERRPRRAAGCLAQAARSESPCSAALRPACQGEAPSSATRTVFMPLDSIVRQTVAICGASRLTSTNVRQSNDCTVTRSPICAESTAVTTARANVAASAVGTSAPGVIFVSILKRNELPRPANGRRAPGRRARQASVCAPRRKAFCTGHCVAYLCAGLRRPTS